MKDYQIPASFIVNVVLTQGREQFDPMRVRAHVLNTNPENTRFRVTLAINGKRVQRTVTVPEWLLNQARMSADCCAVNNALHSLYAPYGFGVLTTFQEDAQ